MSWRRRPRHSGGQSLAVLGGPWADQTVRGIRELERSASLDAARGCSGPADVDRRSLPPVLSTHRPPQLLVRGTLDNAAPYSQEARYQANGGPRASVVQQRGVDHNGRRLAR